MLKKIALAAVVSLCLAGCSSGNNQGSAQLKPVDARSSPDLVVKNAVETRTSLSSLAGKGVMRIVDKPSRFGLTVNADVVADETDNRLRIKADKLAGSIQAFDVVMLGDDIGFYIPTQKTLYSGKVSDLRYFAFRFDPDEVLQQMLRPETSLLLKRWRHADARQDDPANAIAFQEEAPGNRPYQRVAINRKTGTLMAITLFDARGEPVFVKRYDDYRNLARDRRGSKTGPDSIFPYLISFSWPRDNRMMEMRFKSVEGNAVVLDEDFDIATSADTRYLPLTDAQMDPGLADDPLASAASASDEAYASLRTR